MTLAALTWGHILSKVISVLFSKVPQKCKPFVCIFFFFFSKVLEKWQLSEICTYFITKLKLEYLFKYYLSMFINFHLFALGILASQYLLNVYGRSCRASRSFTLSSKKFVSIPFPASPLKMSENIFTVLSQLKLYD